MPEPVAIPVDQLPGPQATQWQTRPGHQKPKLTPSDVTACNIHKQDPEVPLRCSTRSRKQPEKFQASPFFITNTENQEKVCLNRQ